MHELFSLVPRVFQLGNKTSLILCNPLFNFLPSRRTILILHAHNAVDNSVNFSFILACNPYLGFLENFLKMPKIASQTNHLKIELLINNL